MKQLSIVFFILLSSICKGQTDNVFEEKLQHCFTRYNEQSAQEKIYLHTDKSVYMPGEQIWLRAYLADAVTHVPSRLSRYVYVELIDQGNKVCKRIQVRLADSCFFGNIELPLDLNPGNYALRAYSRWMQNSSEDFFFRKYIRILPAADNLHIHTNQQTDSNDRITTTLTLMNGDGTLCSGQHFQTALCHGNKTVKNPFIRSNDKGELKFDYAGRDSIDRIELSFANDKPRKYKTEVYLPLQSPDFSLQFFPEGGNLLAGMRQVIAFKAVGNNGISVETGGFIYNNNNKPVGAFNTTHLGMGVFSLFPKNGERYYALATGPGGQEKKIDLPVPQAKGYILSLKHQDEHTIRLSVGKAVDSDTLPLYLVLHLRGQLIATFPVKPGFIGAMDTQSLPGGILHCLLMNTEGRVFSQRLCFIKPKASNRLTILSDKKIYDRREKVQLSLQLIPSAATFTGSSFSISVTNDSQVARDSSSENIVSYLLLHSDLKGYIESPGSYAYARPEETDLLMLTHGWTRFDVEELIKQEGKMLPPEYPVELEQQIRGQITNTSDKPMPNALLRVFVPSLMTFGDVKADENGKFLIRGFEYPDTTLFLVRGYKESGGKSVKVTVEEPVFPESHIFFPRKYAFQSTSKDNFLDNFKGNYYMQDGIKVYMLEEAVVKGSRKKQEEWQETGNYTELADYLLKEEDLPKESMNNIYQMLMRLPGVFVSNQKVSIRGGGSPLFIVDGIEMDEAFIANIIPENVNNIGVIKDGGRLSMWGMSGINGVILINTKFGTTGQSAGPGYCRFRPVGCLIPAEFYMPDYDDPAVLASSETDYRSTVYWQPIVIPDSTGKAIVSFFTADLPSTYTITVEGLLDNGEAIHQEIGIERN